MHYKRKVLERFPDAEPVIVQTWENGTPRHISIFTNRGKEGERRLDIHDEAMPQMHVTAWRSAWFWMVRNPAPADAPVGLPDNGESREAYRLCCGLGLSLTYFNSGSTRNAANGWRVFRGLGRTRFFDEDFLLHRRTPAEVVLFLYGYVAGLSDAKRVAS